MGNNLHNKTHKILINYKLKVASVDCIGCYLVLCFTFSKNSRSSRVCFCRLCELFVSR